MREKIVWILGAGFSRHLGGPLLGEIFTPASKGNLEARYPLNDYPRLGGPTASLIRSLYRFGRGLSVTVRGGIEVQGETLWGDAEEFLEYVDTATAEGAGSSPEWRRLSPLVDRFRPVSVPADVGRPERLGATARRLLAAECSAFLRSEGVRGERWIPYLEWWKRLTPDREHTIITFNYDLVIESLDSQLKKAQFVHPTERQDGPAPDQVPVIKLHGSVDWKRAQAEGAAAKYEIRQRPDFAVTCEDNELAIATPGLTKHGLVSGDFRYLWQRAGEALATADAVAFVGYRFPPTDSAALWEILGAIAKNNSRHLALHTVLGPNSQDESRLHSLLRFPMRDKRRLDTASLSVDDRKRVGQGGLQGDPLYTLVSQGLWAQDFLLLAHPHEISQAYLVQWR